MSTHHVSAAPQVRQVRKALEATYTDLIDMSDYDRRPHLRQDAFLSRALTAHAVRILTGWGPEDAVACVIDGGQDLGLDAIVPVRRDTHVYIVQTKWSNDGKATIGKNAAHAMRDGLQAIDSQQFSEFNPRGEPLAREAQRLMADEMAGVTLVTVLMGTRPPAHESAKAFRRIEDEFNTHGKRADCRFIHAAELWQKVREDIAPKSADLTAALWPWFSIAHPFESYVGVMTAEDVAGWLAEHGTDLFVRNIRDPLGLTVINNDLLKTLETEPASFWYFNNGITVLCDSVDKREQSMLVPQKHPLGLVAHGASVVNGAQTVRAIADAVARGGAEEASAQVSVRIIVTGNAQEFAERTTQATNSQNRITARDFVSLDPVQAALRQEFRAELDLEYQVRRSELPPPEETGCALEEAAYALTCAHPDAGYVARVARNRETLWERGTAGVYDVLFRPQPDAFHVWNAVAAVRSVRKTLDGLRGQYTGRGSAAIEHGTFLIAHIAIRALGTEGIEDPEETWTERAKAQLPDLLKRRLFPVFLTAMDDLYGDRLPVKTICTSPEQCQELAEEVLDRLATGSSSGDSQKYHTLLTPTQWRKKRRPNATKVILDSGALDEGTPLRLHPVLAPERQALETWLAEDSKRSMATWRPHLSKPLLWHADGRQYSPSGLIRHMWEQARWEGRPVSNQGPARWLTPDGETLAALATRLLAEREEPGPDADDQAEG